MTELLTPRSPPWPFALGALVLLATFGISGAYAVNRVKDQLYRERVRAGEIMVSALAGSARIPLLGDDTLSLHSLVEEATHAQGLVYAVILDANKRAKAQATSASHADVLKAIPGGLESMRRGGQTPVVTEVLPSDPRILRISRPVTFGNKTIGYIVLGFSRNEFDHGAWVDGRFLWVVFAALGVFAVGVLSATSIWLLGQGNLAGERATGAAAHGNAVKAPTESGLDRSHVAVLFAGVKGFKKYADTREPGQVISDMNGYVAVATQAITKFGGEVDKFVGDSVVAVFRSTVLKPDHIERAVRSATAIQKTLKQAHGDGNPLYATIGIGISSGVALSGRLDVGSRKESLYMGETFKAAYLLQAIADPGEIIISRDVYQVMVNFVSVEPLAPREMLERTEPWENFRLLQVLDEREIGA